MLQFGEGFTLYKPAIDTKTIKPVQGKMSNGNGELVLNWITRTRNGVSTAPTPTTCAC